MRLKDKVAIVTGASRGIGKAIALAFAKEGANVVVTARTEEEIKKVSNEIQSSGSKSMAIKGDVTVKKDIEKVVRKTVEEFEKIDILVNSAGIYLKKPIIDTTESELEKIMEVNFKSVFLWTKIVTKYMIEQRSGTIINIVSNAGKQPYLNEGIYCASKHAVVGFSGVFAIEMKEHNIRVHVICPGGVDTKLQKGSSIPKEKLIKPEDIADVCVFLSFHIGNAIIEEVIIKRFFK